MPKLIVTVEHSDIRTGAWCTPCALPSVVEFDLLILGESGISTIGTARLCTECGDLS